MPYLVVLLTLTPIGLSTSSFKDWVIVAVGEYYHIDSGTALASPALVGQLYFYFIRPHPHLGAKV